MKIHLAASIFLCIIFAHCTICVAEQNALSRIERTIQAAGVCNDPHIASVDHKRKVIAGTCKACGGNYSGDLQFVAYFNTVLGNYNVYKVCVKHKHFPLRNILDADQQSKLDRDGAVEELRCKDFSQ